ncbi:hypothetical protein [Mycobacteroides immunogenum]|uniref:Lipoprotein LppI n=1 Tax=Mycobacteroides immunogenum TaxID=83262 RepID=A0A7V8LRZ0_9MYCO|nr:hypothetical protein [Mycobacteroides immunogenum]AMT71702.1 hypothetical protein ABG82_16770 [Mycobacteroides immunogenum]ANO04823.1 hypothetical protein BAB75_17035 [Mycobacteroides immunogenum]KIU37747.1 hypothetical protein TL11_26115 [Mycobacteroides immunogenum]KPG15307.1 hypothetical protein AN909_03020 [Mycobacteroides immunogenum]KPG15920.1 hypothetical protein AN910_08170 [Mycobacteroides immunogenum]
MRALLLGGLTLLGALLLVTGCSKGASVSPTTPPTSQPPSGSSSTSKAPTTTTTSKTPVELPEPVAGTPYDAVAQWISKGAPVDVTNFHTAISQDGQKTDLGSNVAFKTPSGKTRCMTDNIQPGTLSCLVNLTNPPKRPADTEGNWVGGWTDFKGGQVTVGGLHGDPGPFQSGDGNPLDYGGRLSFGDFSCRSETSGLFCADTKSKSAIRISDAGIEPFGCLKETTPADGAGREFSC